VRRDAAFVTKLALGWAVNKEILMQSTRAAATHYVRVILNPSYRRRAPLVRDPHPGCAGWVRCSRGRRPPARGAGRPRAPPRVRGLQHAHAVHV
jgi:hypothetical protein